MLVYLAAAAALAAAEGRVPLVVAPDASTGSGGTAAAPVQRPAWPDLASPSARQGGGERDAAVVVGIEDYAFVPDVAGAARNAEDFYRHLVSVRGVPADRAVLLRNSEANVENIRDAVERVRGLAAPGGTLWFVFVGHGAPALDGKDGVLVGFDAQQSARTLFARSLPRAELLAALAKRPEVKPVAVLDACFSGRTAGGDALAPNLQPLLPVVDAAPAVAATVLSAGKSHQLAGSLPGTGRPAFSYLVLGALRGWGDADGDGTVTAAEAVSWSAGALRATVRDREQTPELAGAAIPLATAARERGPDLASIVLGAPIASADFFAGSWTCRGTRHVAAAGQPAAYEASMSISPDAGAGRSGLVIIEAESRRFASVARVGEGGRVSLSVRGSEGTQIEAVSRGWDGTRMTYEGEISNGELRFPYRMHLERGADGSLTQRAEGSFSGTWKALSEERCVRR